MGILMDRLTSRLGDLDAQMARIKANAAADIAVLQKEREILVGAATLISTDIEAAFAALQQIGVFPAK